MRRLDDSTLEVVAETICGAGQGTGGGPSYEAPGPYRTKSALFSFFRRAGVEPAGQSSTRKWFVLESLQALNQGTSGSVIPAGLEKVLLRLASPQEYRGDAETTQAVVDYLNKSLLVEGLEIMLNGVVPSLRERAAAVAPPPPKFKREAPPDFMRLVSEPRLAQILTFRWEEAQRCVEAKAFLAGIVMMGSILEGVILHRTESCLEAANRACCVPKDRNGKVRPIHEWSLSQLTDIGKEHFSRKMRLREEHAQDILKDVLTPIHEYLKEFYLPACRLEFSPLEVGTESIHRTPDHITQDTYVRTEFRISIKTPAKTGQSGLYRDQYWHETEGFRRYFDDAIKYHYPDLLARWRTFDEQYKTMVGMAQNHAEAVIPRIQQTAGLPPLMPMGSDSATWANYHRLAVLILDRRLGMNEGGLYFSSDNKMEVKGLKINNMNISEARC